jgi:hypothetical protein
VAGLTETSSTIAHSDLYPALVFHTQKPEFRPSMVTVNMRRKRQRGNTVTPSDSFKKASLMGLASELRLKIIEFLITHKGQPEIHYYDYKTSYINHYRSSLFSTCKTLAKEFRTVQAEQTMLSIYHNFPSMPNIPNDTRISDKCFTSIDVNQVRHVQVAAFMPLFCGTDPAQWGFRSPLEVISEEFARFPNAKNPGLELRLMESNIHNFGICGQAPAVRDLKITVLACSRPPSKFSLGRDQLKQSLERIVSNFPSVTKIDLEWRGHWRHFVWVKADEETVLVKLLEDVNKNGIEVIAVVKPPLDMDGPFL